MTPKEKLQELLNNLYELNSFQKKKLAITVLISNVIGEISEFDTQYGATERFDYWNKVKEELEKL